MDKNNIIGFLLIAVVLIGFSWYNQPSAEEQRAAFEANKENTTLFGMVLYDNQYVYTYYLYKPDDVHVSNYKLRDVIQYVAAKYSKSWNDKAFAGVGFSPSRLQFMEIRQNNKNVGNDKTLSTSKE